MLSVTKIEYLKVIVKVKCLHTCILVNLGQLRKFVPSCRQVTWGTVDMPADREMTKILKLAFENADSPLEIAIYIPATVRHMSHYT